MRAIVATVLFILQLTLLHGQTLTVRSPNGRLVFALTVRDDGDDHGALFYTLQYDGKSVILPSRLGLVTMDLPSWAHDFKLIGQARRSVDETWNPVYGERSRVLNRFSECTVNLIKDDDKHNQLDLRIRVYDTGAAFCYHFPEDLATSVLHIKDEVTEFAFEDGALAYITPFAQELYHLRPLRDWSYDLDLPLPRWAARTPEYESERPLTLVLPNGLYAAIGEARLTNYSRMKFILPKPGTIRARLFGPVTESSPFTTPWRVIMVADRAGALIENNDIFLNLNPPCVIDDTRWIKPGKVLREVTLSNAGAQACLNFCAQHNIQYLEFDAGWYGYEYSKASDASRVSVDPRRNPSGDLDLQAIIDAARRKGIGVILYVNHRALEKQMDDIFPLYRQWGVVGLKFGFVHVGSHRWTTWLYEAVQKAAENQLMVDIHDEYRPTGVSRTLPNLMTQEGVYGNECMPEATHNTILPFTRFLAGAADYTICYYHQSSIKNVQGIKTTSAHQLALGVIYYSPWQFVFWYDRPSDYQGEPEIEFFDRLPTAWDTTAVILGDIGKYIAVARRSGNEWFLGTITNNDARELEIPLAFLEAGQTYLAALYSDAGEAVPTRTHVRIDRFLVTSDTTLTTKLSPSGGMAMHIRPATSDELKRFTDGSDRH